MPIVRQRKIPSLDSLVDRLRAGSDQTLQRDVLNAMMTHETSFFAIVLLLQHFKKLFLNS